MANSEALTAFAPLTDFQKQALEAYGLRWASEYAPVSGVRYSVAWSNHERRWVSSCAHVDKALREVQCGPSRTP